MKNLGHKLSHSTLLLATLLSLTSATVFAGARYTIDDGMTIPTSAGEPVDMSKLGHIVGKDPGGNIVMWYLSPDTSTGRWKPPTNWTGNSLDGGLFESANKVFQIHDPTQSTDWDSVNETYIPYKFVVTDINNAQSNQSLGERVVGYYWAYPASAGGPGTTRTSGEPADIRRAFYFEQISSSPVQFSGNTLYNFFRYKLPCTPDVQEEFNDPTNTAPSQTLTTDCYVWSTDLDANSKRDNMFRDSSNTLVSSSQFGVFERECSPFYNFNFNLGHAFADDVNAKNPNYQEVYFVECDDEAAALKVNNNGIIAGTSYFNVYSGGTYLGKFSRPVFWTKSGDTRDKLLNWILGPVTTLEGCMLGLSACTAYIRDIYAPREIIPRVIFKTEGNRIYTYRRFQSGYMSALHPHSNASAGTFDFSSVAAPWAAYKIEQRIPNGPMLIDKNYSGATPGTDAMHVSDLAGFNVIGWYIATDAQSSQHDQAYYWDTYTNSAYHTGSLGGQSSRLLAASEENPVMVGTAENSSGQMRAMSFSPSFVDTGGSGQGCGMQDINELLLAPAAAELTEAYAITPNSFTTSAQDNLILAHDGSVTKDLLAESENYLHHVNRSPKGNTYILRQVTDFSSLDVDVAIGQTTKNRPLITGEEDEIIYTISHGSADQPGFNNYATCIKVVIESYAYDPDKNINDNEHQLPGGITYTYAQSPDARCHIGETNITCLITRLQPLQSTTLKIRMKPRQLLADRYVRTVATVTATEEDAESIANPAPGPAGDSARNNVAEYTVRVDRDTGCFIAGITAGTLWHHQLGGLRQWRDKLKGSIFGRWIVQRYYDDWSPTLKQQQPNTWVNAAVWTVLIPTILISNLPGWLSLLFMVLLAGMAYRHLRRRRQASTAVLVEKKNP